MRFMKSNTLESKSTDELWSLYEQVASILARKIEAEKIKLEDRLSVIEKTMNGGNSGRLRRPYPKVFPKYQNPNNSAETWSGRGRQPHWVRAQIKAGKTLEHFLIASLERRLGAGG
jgi:DNA-binding protein H-NS